VFLPKGTSILYIELFDLHFIVLLNNLIMLRSMIWKYHNVSLFWLCFCALLVLRFQKSYPPLLLSLRLKQHKYIPQDVVFREDFKGSKRGLYWWLVYRYRRWCGPSWRNKVSGQMQRVNIRSWHTREPPVQLCYRDQCVMGKGGYMDQTLKIAVGKVTATVGGGTIAIQLVSRMPLLFKDRQGLT